MLCFLKVFLGELFVFMRQNSRELIGKGRRETRGVTCNRTPWAYRADGCE